MFKSTVCLALHKCIQTGFLKIHVSCLWIYVISHVGPSGPWPSGEPLSIRLAGHHEYLILCGNFCTKFFHFCHAYRHYWLLPLYTFFKWLWPWQGFTRSAQNKTCWLLFYQALQLIRMKSNVAISNSSWTFWYQFWLRLNEWKEITAAQIIAKNFKIGMDSNIQWIRFKLNLMIDSTELYTLILVWVTLALIQGHKLRESKKFFTRGITEFSVYLDEIWYAVKTWWYDKQNAHFFLAKQYPREKTHFMQIHYKQNFNIA